MFPQSTYHLLSSHVCCHLFPFPPYLPLSLYLSISLSLYPSISYDKCKQDYLSIFLFVSVIFFTLLPNHHASSSSSPLLLLLFKLKESLIIVSSSYPLPAFYLHLIRSVLLCFLIAFLSFFFFLSDKIFPFFSFTFQIVPKILSIHLFTFFSHLLVSYLPFPSPL
jgi:hypothetical protein